MSSKRIAAIAYLRTSSAANVGADKDSDKRQRAAIDRLRQGERLHLEDEFYDAAVSGSDPVGERPGFKAMLDRIAGNGVRVILVESPDRFARDLAVQLAGHDYPALARRGARAGLGAGLLHRGHADRGAGAPGARRHRAVRESLPGRQAAGRARAQEGGRRPGQRSLAL